MMETLKKIFGQGAEVDYAGLVKTGALILDVRTPGEYTGGHISGSWNIPVDQLKDQLGRLSDKNRAIITCCASGMRSASAASLLKSNGYVNVYNGGAWTGLQSKLRKK